MPLQFGTRYTFATGENWLYGNGNKQAVREELEQIKLILEEILGLPSRWSGILEMTEDPRLRGAKPFRCDIILHNNLSGQPVRWRTLIHELLHTFSAGYFPLDYLGFRGWEEGTVEQLQRLLRPDILSRIGVTVENSVFEAIETNHEYREYVAALEDLRVCLQRHPREFYQMLLSIPIKDRRRDVFSEGMKLELDQRFVFLRTYSTADAVLRTGTAL